MTVYQYADLHFCHFLWNEWSEECLLSAYIAIQQFVLNLPESAYHLVLQFSRISGISVILSGRGKTDSGFRMYGCSGRNQIYKPEWTLGGSAFGSHEQVAEVYTLSGRKDLYNENRYILNYDNLLGTG